MRIRPTVPLNDLDIREALRPILVSKYSLKPDTVMIEELGLRHGFARVDIAIVNGLLQGFEIKSDADTLGRLQHQLNIYNSTLHEITLIVGSVHLVKALQIAPAWWGVELAEWMTGSGIQFVNIRSSQRNPLVDPLAIVKLLWREEALAVLDEIGDAKGVRAKPRKQVYERLVQCADPLWLSARVCQQLRTRQNWRPDARRKLDDD